MNQQDKHDKRVLDMYKNKVRNNTLTIEQSIYDIVQNIQFVDQLPINVLKVYYSYDIRFDRVPSKITNLQFTNAPQTNFMGFEQMKQLMILSLNDNQLSQINFISSLINLTNLNVCSNIIKDLSPLQNLIQLKEINLDYNKIEDISPLRKLLYYKGGCLNSRLCSKYYDCVFALNDLLCKYIKIFVTLIHSKCNQQSEQIAATEQIRILIVTLIKIMLKQLLFVYHLVVNITNIS
ncbi:leucine-rich_repeat domain-containing protein [Hexamita inflata]|uniref:Leucine-rich_repeat domain-containing protein n=1 Tax=Hexamita inflata TaxID=28002 RepID=A0ABP1GI73_9EUKA